MGEITRPRPALVKALGWTLGVVGVTGVVGIVMGLLERSYLSAHLAEGQAAAPFQSELDRAVGELKSSAALAIFLGVLGLIALFCAWLVYDVRPQSRLTSFVLGIAILVGHLLLMTQNVTAGYLDGTGVSVERAELVNSFIRHPAFHGTIFAVEVVSIIGGIVIFLLCVHPDVKEFLRIRLEPPKDEAWDRAVQVRRAAVELERENG